MNADLGKASFSDEEMEQMRTEVLLIRDEEGLSWNDIKNESGIPVATMSTWTSGKYEGDNDNVAGRVKLWFDSRNEKAELVSSVQDDPKFQLTASAKTIINRLKFAQALGDFAVIGGVPGIGKTSSIIQYSATRPRVYVSTVSPASRGVQTMLIELLRDMGEKEPRGTPAALSQRVIEKLGTAGGALIIIDESHFLTEQSIEQLRSIHDKTGVGLALVGNEEIYTRLDGIGSKACFAQIASRIGIRHSQHKTLPEDVEILATAWGITDQASLSFLQKLAAKPGGLRNVAKTVKLARITACGADEQVKFTHIKDAWAQRGQSAA